MSSEYEAAYDAITEATKQHAEVVRAYRNREVGDEVFLASLEKYRQAEAQFDAAFAKEST
jgi:hypothetical protein